MFIDGANLYATAKALGFDIDYRRLFSDFQSRGTLVRAFYYTAVIEDQEYSSIRPLIDWLDYNGYTVVTKATKEFIDASGRRKVKGSMDIELAVDAMELAAHIDQMILFSGDGDFRSLVAAVQRRGRLSAPRDQAAQPAGGDPRLGAPGLLRRPPRGRARICAGRNRAQGKGATRGAARRRLDQFAAAVAALGSGPRRIAACSWHRGRARFAGGRREPAGPSKFARRLSSPPAEYTKRNLAELAAPGPGGARICAGAVP